LQWLKASETLKVVVHVMGINGRYTKHAANALLLIERVSTHCPLEQIAPPLETMGEPVGAVAWGLVVEV
jgi:hypothetical protein